MQEQYNEPGLTVAEQAGVEDSEETSCPICLEPDAEQRTLTSCGHFFCRSVASLYRKANSPDPRLTCSYSEDYNLGAHYLETYFDYRQLHTIHLNPSPPHPHSPFSYNQHCIAHFTHPSYMPLTPVCCSLSDCIHGMLTAAPKNEIPCPMCRLTLTANSLHDVSSEEEAAKQEAKRRAEIQISGDYGTKVGGLFAPLLLTVIITYI